MNENIAEITERIIVRSKTTRQAYLKRIDAAGDEGVNRSRLSCGNLAHGFAACNASDKARVRSLTHSDIAIVSAYNDILSAHQPYKDFPDLIKQAISEAGGVAQFAGGVPAMCDGVTQGQSGMDLSLMSRDTIALASAVALSHNLFDGALMLGICDKIVPGLLIGALSFGHLPVVFVPSGPMPSGLPNKEKSKVRKLYAEGKVGKDSLLDAEAQSYHAPGTCTFYGTANSNQLVVEMMGLHLPGASFVQPNNTLRDELTKAAARQVTRLTRQSGNYLPMGRMLDEKSLVNGIIGLVATGGSTNLTMHLVAVARAAGILLTWDDFADISRQIPLLTHIYPSGSADINDFQQAGGMAQLFRELLDHELLHDDVQTIVGKGLDKYLLTPLIEDGELQWRAGPGHSRDTQVLASVGEPFKQDGGLNVLKGNLGQSVIKTSALTEQQLRITAPAIIFEDQHELAAAFEQGQLNQDCIVVVRYQGPQARGMPELHKLTPPLSVLQDRGFKVALVTDGRMSGASGNVPAAIHLCPEALAGGLIAKIRPGDMISLDAVAGTLELLVSADELAGREHQVPDLSHHHQGCGRELFGRMRINLSSAAEGACSLF
ncbi:MAG: phosphogluconate dehydratase [Pseudomonadales bacterium]|nr:phosphogluconate dehydratase [Pseudomonadales bacterium]